MDEEEDMNPQKVQNSPKERDRPIAMTIKKVKKGKKRPVAASQSPDEASLDLSDVENDKKVK